MARLRIFLFAYWKNCTFNAYLRWKLKSKVRFESLLHFLVNVLVYITRLGSNLPAGLGCTYNKPTTKTATTFPSKSLFFPLALCLWRDKEQKDWGRGWDLPLAVTRLRLYPTGLQYSKTKTVIATTVRHMTNIITQTAGLYGSAETEDRRFREAGEIHWRWLKHSWHKSILESQAYKTNLIQRAK